MYLTTENSPNTVLGSNKQVYNQLKLALQLGLRRQIFVAVCDDLRLMYRIAARLELDMASTRVKQPEQFGSRQSLGLVTLQLNLKDPSPIAQIGTWLRRQPKSKMPRIADPFSPALPNFQFLGVDLLTRKSSASQWYFLNELQEVRDRLPNLEFSLILWLTRPWCRTIAQSAPEFWSCRTGVFEFLGEPTPTTGIDDFPVEKSRNRIIPITSDLQKSGNLDTTNQQRSATKKSQAEENSQVFGQIFDRNSTRIDDRKPSESNTEPKSDRPPLPIGSISTAKATDLPKLEIVGMSDRSELATETQSIAESIAENLTPNHFNSKLYQLIGSTFLSSESQKQSNPDRKISESSVLEILQDIERLDRQQPPAKMELANAYLGLGNLYRVALGRGESNQTYLKIAIAAYEKVLELRDRLPEEQNFLSHELGNDIGNFYWMLCRFDSHVSERISYLEQAIAAYQKSLSKINPDRQPDVWAMIQNNLGSVYNELSRHRDPLQYLQLSIQAYQQVLRYRPDFQTIQESSCSEAEKIAKIQGFATTQNNLATAYWNLAQHEESPNHLKESLSAYTQALIALESPINPDQSPQWFLNYAMIQNNLGTGYWNLSVYENAENNLQLAIGAYQIALMYRTPDAAPVASAATQNNLGTAYLHLSKYSPKKSPMWSECLRQAIAAYSTALEIAKQLQNISSEPDGNCATSGKSPTVTFDLFATHNNLGNAYYQLASESEPESGLEQVQVELNQALHYHLEASIGWQQTGQTDLAENAINHVVQTIRAFYNLLGVQGQNLALSQVPGQLLPEVMPRLSGLRARN